MKNKKTIITVALGCFVILTVLVGVLAFNLTYEKPGCKHGTCVSNWSEKYKANQENGD